MDEVVLARHGESETAARRIVGGDAPLTAVGQEQARALGRAVAGTPIEVCITSNALRARETAAIALAGRAIPFEVDDRLGDIEFGVFDGAALAEYRDWISAHAPDDAPPGGESRVATLRRFCDAYRSLLERPEHYVLVVAHGLTVSALTDEAPKPVVAGVPYGSSVRLTADELRIAVARVEDWCEAPAW
jgi:broad specificity phosphatase PhoE